jgi:hypothetical protein
MLQSFLLCRLLGFLFFLHPFKQAAIIDSPDSVLVKKPVLVFAEGVQHLPLREASQPAIILPTNSEII